MKLVKPGLTQIHNQIGREIVDSAFAVHKKLGPGLLERIYESCFCFELADRGFQVEKQVPVPIVYKGITLEEGYRVDVLINNLIICELKAHTPSQNQDLWKAQLLTYMKLKRINLGYLINFNVALIKNGISRVILSHF